MLYYTPIVDWNTAEEAGQRIICSTMGWERRGNNQYYYKKKRDGARVRSVYVGNGEIAHMISTIQSTSPLFERLAHSMKSSETVEQEKVEDLMDQLGDRICLVTQATLLVTGFHTHKRQWRKLRHG